MEFYYFYKIFLRDLEQNKKINRTTKQYKAANVLATGLLQSNEITNIVKIKKRNDETDLNYSTNRHLCVKLLARHWRDPSSLSEILLDPVR